MTTSRSLPKSHNGKLNDATAKALTAARPLSARRCMFWSPARTRSRAGRRQDRGRGKGSDSPRATPSHGLAEPLAELIVSLAPNYDAIVAPATSTCKNVLPRVAALLDVAQVSEISKVVAPDTFERPIYAGNAIQTVQRRIPKR